MERIKAYLTPIFLNSLSDKTYNPYRIAREQLDLDPDLSSILATTVIYITRHTGKELKEWPPSG
jgi:hypothetical protein